MYNILMLEFRFTDAQSGANRDGLARRLVQPRLWVPGGDYPAHMDWVDKAISEWDDGKKRAILAYWGDEAVGTVVYQRHKNIPTALEIKNISVEPHARGRHVAGFLLRQAEIEGQHDFPSVTTIISDTKVTNSALLNFVARNGYNVTIPPTLETHFAHNGTPDAVLTKQVPAILRP